ncbi:M20/M25/M40 family metallo-hydrolase [Actinomadura darangshiensis]|uniref:M20/M25/M40 family metallo-hydrolase n=1 Tax=Actinomadura darangshiensis TaxID=705336 RepID=A0A4R5AZN2_9ACTN|nr:M20/M25/M40 family metallo-hydrolase [Actinomadura darangshiensis]TDD77689.1 M20/M25/M40 family metallo-hydrolase [Actinomadura darangshiensis]
MSDDIRQAVKHVMPGVRADLETLMRIPSVSADFTAAAELRRCAVATAELFAAAGASRTEILNDIDDGWPAVVAHFPPPAGMPTVLLYAHYDVQPAGDLALWTNPPFEPTEIGGRLYGRGSADDKAGIAAHLAAVRAYDGLPPVGVTVLVEGEEEIGSPTLGTFLDRYRDRLTADAIVLADSENFAAGVPAFTTTLRGLAGCVVEVRTLEQGVHSGTYGGAAPDALTVLCRLLATLHDENGDVAVDGLATSWRPTVDYPEERFRTEAAMLDGVPLMGTGTVADRIWSKAAATVLAIDAPPVAGASNTLTPAARAKVSLRLAPGDDAASAQAALARHLHEHAPKGVLLDVTATDSAEPHAIDPRGPVYDAARRAYRTAYGADVADIGGGGAIPFVAAFAAAFPEAAILVTSAGADPDCRAHSADENLHLADFENTCLAETLLLNELASLPKRDVTAGSSTR